MKKILLLLFMVFCISGCDVNYELFYKNSGEILENIDVKFSNSNALLYNDSIESYAKDMFNGWRDSYNLKNYDYKLSLGRETSTIKVSKTHDNLSSLINNTAFNSFFSNINISNGKNESPTLEFSDYVYAVKNNDEEIYLEEPSNESSNLYIVIRSNYKLETNADEINDNIGVYKWKFTPEDSNKTLKVTFTDEFNIFAYFYNLSSVIITILVIFVLIVVSIIIFNFIKRKNFNANKI